jgi:D-alanyl-lipoteichoic acid acyltransferase DltB (MBOAT superfamily)
LAVLCFWKYTPLIVSTMSWLGYATILADKVTAPGKWHTPMGLSFYAFTGIAYMVDVYRRVTIAEPNLFRFGLFTSFFPHLVAGPILRAKEFLTHLSPAALPQRPEMPVEGVSLIARGYFKKLLIADSIASAIDPFFAEIAHPSTAGLWSLPYLYLYSWQIFFDFSGYTDIARGLGLLFGFRWPENFQAPYLAGSVREFWHRWHMTLSRFMRDYLYIPLGGNRQSLAGYIFAVMVTFTLSGFWHGASWTFLFWGATHGVLLLLNRGWQKLKVVSPLLRFESVPASLRRTLAIFLTFNAVSLVWSFFRITRLPESWACLQKTARFDSAKAFVGGAADPSVWLLLGAYAIGVLGFGRLRRGKSLPEFFASLRQQPLAQGMIIGGALGLLIISILLARGGQTTPFIYFQF